VKWFKLFAQSSRGWIEPVVEQRRVRKTHGGGDAGAINQRTQKERTITIWTHGIIFAASSDFGRNGATTNTNTHSGVPKILKVEEAPTTTGQGLIYREKRGRRDGHRAHERSTREIPPLFFSSPSLPFCLQLPPTWDLRSFPKNANQSNCFKRWHGRPPRFPVKLRKLIKRRMSHILFFKLFSNLIALHKDKIWHCTVLVWMRNEHCQAKLIWRHRTMPCH